MSSMMKKKQNRLSTLALGLVAGLLAAGAASATQMTVTWDYGAFDPASNHGDGPTEWVESNGIRITPFWATNVGTAIGGFSHEAHPHRDLDFRDRPDGAQERLHAWTKDLQGFVVTIESGAAFSVLSIDYSITNKDSINSSLKRLPWAFGVEDPQLLMTESFDPTISPIESAWTAFGISDFGAPPVAWPNGPWFTRAITGIDGVTNVFIATTAGLVEVDNLVLDVHDVTPVPEPTTAVLMGLGLMGIAARRRPGR
jgi:hypothetical protein